MATSGEVAGQRPGGAGSDNLHQMKCQPCLEDGNVHEAVGMCMDCDEYLCYKCFESHTVPRPLRHHKLLDREQIPHGKIRASPKDTCTEHCPIHEDEVIKYYCLTHCLLGCTACITLEHATCKTVQYIPHVAKETANNEDYRQVERQLNSAVKTFEQVFQNAQMNSEELNKSCADAVNSIHAFRKQVDDYLRRIEKEMVGKAHAIQVKAKKELEKMTYKYKRSHEELQSSLAKIGALRNAKQNCSSYIEMMRAKGKLQSLGDQIKEASVDTSYRKRKIQFHPNTELLETLTNTGTFGTMSETDPQSILAGSDEVTILSDSDTRTVVSGPDTISLSGPVTSSGSDRGTIIKATHVKDINVKTEDDKSAYMMTGIAALGDNRLALTVHNYTHIKVVSVQNGQVFEQLSLSSSPWDIVSLKHDTIAVTLPDEKKLVLLTVADNKLNIYRTISVDGLCYGIDYKNDNLAVSFLRPAKVQVLTMQGSVLYTIAHSKPGEKIVSGAFYLAFGQDDKTLYVSNYCSDNVVCVKFDGTVVSTYKDSTLKGPEKVVVDSRGNVYVCSCATGAIHQLTKDCKKLRVIVTKKDGVRAPYSVCLNEDENEMYVGMGSDDNFKVFTTERETN